jgi:hypothetical protein
MHAPTLIPDAMDDDHDGLFPCLCLYDSLQYSTVQYSTVPAAYKYRHMLRLLASRYSRNHNSNSR